MHGLSRLANAAQREQAWIDWEYVAARASAAGREDLVRQHQPAQFAGAAAIDRSIAAVRAAFGWPLVWEMRAAERGQSVSGDRS